MLENIVSYLRNKGIVLSELSKLSEHSMCSECQLKFVTTESVIEHDDYLQQLSNGGTLSIALFDFIFQIFLALLTLFHQQERPSLKLHMSEVFQRGCY